MAEREEGRAWQVERVSTGVPHLDDVLGGGLTAGSFVLIVGGPGTGKTVLAEQMAFHWAAQGQNTLWLVTLGEPNEKFLAHLTEMRFFDRRQIGAAIQLVNLSRLLRQGYEEKLEAIRETLRNGSYSFVVIDGFQSFRCFLGDTMEMRLFLSELSTELALMGITLVITADANPERYWEDPEFTMADAIIVLSQTMVGGRRQRRLNVLKLRGHTNIGGEHSLSIDGEGVHIHPRAEDLLPRGQASAGGARLGFDLPALDGMLEGGLLEGSATLIAGSSGTGKSLLAAHFMAAGLRRSEPALQYAFFESREGQIGRGEAFGLPLRRTLEEGLLHLRCCQPWLCDPDALAEEIAQTVERQGIRRLVIDGIDAIERQLAASHRAIEYLTALVDYLRLQQVTTVLTYELPGRPEVLRQALRPSAEQVAAGIIELRYDRARGHLRRLLSIVKTRYSHHSSALAELLIEEGRLSIVEMPRESEETPIPLRAW